VLVQGNPDPRTGYLVDIKRIDMAVRRSIGSAIERSGRLDPAVAPMGPLAELIRILTSDLGSALVWVRWRLGPYHAIQMGRDDPSTVLLRQRFEFAAAHRLHVPDLSDEENRRIFGKCNNPNGHGHNYVIEPCVAVSVDPGGGTTLPLDTIERITNEHVIERFDHKHLNLDTEQFGPGGVNPSVENIARVCYDLLEGPIRTLGAGVRLRSVTVWETDRTSCTYPADPPNT